MGMRGQRPNARDAQQFQPSTCPAGLVCFPRKLGKGSLPGSELPGMGGWGGRVSFGKLKEATYPYIGLCPYRPHMGLRLQQIKGRKEGRTPRGPFAVTSTSTD